MNNTAPIKPFINGIQSIGPARAVNRVLTLILPRIRPLHWLPQMEDVAGQLSLDQTGLMSPELSLDSWFQPPDPPSLGFYAGAASTDGWGGTSVAAAARGEKGVFLSDGGGKAGTFRLLGLAGMMVRRVAFQHYGAHRYLWAGTTAVGNDPGLGCFRWLMTGAEENPEGWRPFAGNWNAGGCRGIAAAANDGSWSPLRQPSAPPSSAVPASE